MKMVSEEKGQDEFSPTVELLNQTCLDLVAEIEKLKKENARLKEKSEALLGPGNRPTLQTHK